ncbi:Superfamily I DNA and RNA helicases [Streptomyces sp. Ncost-T6T-1]|uniref:SAV_2336 N-terminal domain-related protein n=1 Tax=Streptomyces sp. Ncost-T6T-1 TaxID=1100828 RepID=UPI00080486B7|nr:Superfamily I DNA and RNA helicases [Streptomyces sp. Ncost-T6T-1]
MIDRLRRVLDELGYPVTGAELLDVLLLARTLEASRTSAFAEEAQDGAAGDGEGISVDDSPLPEADHEETTEPVAASEVPPRGSGEQEQQAGSPGQRRLLFPDSRTVDSTGSAAQAVRVPGPRTLPGALQLVRSLRPLRESQDHPHRVAVDVEATVRQTAESGTFDVVLRPTRELRNVAVLLVDDSPSMRVWQSLVREVGRLLERSGVFRAVSVHRIVPRELPGRHRPGGVGSKATLVLTDGVDPAWRTGATVDAVAGLGADGPVAILSPLPQRLWRATGLQPEPYFLSATRRFPAARQLQVLDPLTDEALQPAAGRLPVPVVALSPSSLGSWAQLITRPATPQLMQAAILGSAAVDRLGSTGFPTVAPDQLIAAFRGSFSPQAYSLAVRLSTIQQFTPLLMQLVRIATLPDATSTQVAEVLLGGLLRSTDEEDVAAGLPETLRGDGLYTFRPGVRELLSAGLSRVQTQEVTEAVGRALEPYRGRLPDFAALVPARNGAVTLSDEATPFAVLTDHLNSPAQEVETSSLPSSTNRPRVVVADGAALVRGSAAAVADEALSGRLAKLLTGEFVRVHGHRPAPGDVRMWEQGVPELAAALCEAGLSQVEMLIDCALPMSSKRVDVVVAGLDPAKKSPSYVVVELKLWETAIPDADDPALCFVGGHSRPALNPLDQVRGYCEYLTRFGVEGVRFPDRVSGVAYLPRATEQGAGGLRGRERSGRELLFTGENRREFTAYLRTRFSRGHAGARAADELLIERPSIPPQLMAVAPQEVRDRGQFVLLDEQQVAYHAVLEAVRASKRSGRKEVVVVTGGPGSGKSVIALSLLGELYRRGVPVVHATGSAAFTRTMRAVAGAKTPRVQSLFKYFNSFMEADPNGLDVLLCDEAHRIRPTSVNRYTKQALRTGKAQIDELIDAARVSVFFLDEHQVVRSGETGTVAGITAAAERKGLSVRMVSLESQFRCGGSRTFGRWVDRFLGLEPGGSASWEPDGRMRFLVAESPQEMQSFLEERRSAGFSARISAGYCWKWSGPPRQGDPLPLDVVIGDWARPWPPTSDRAISGAPPASLWATDSTGFGQVGNIYTAQGFGYDWGGVIIGPDMVWRDGRFVTDRVSSKDASITKYSTPDTEADRMIRTAYKVLLTRGMVGTVVYSTDAETRAQLLALGGLHVGRTGLQPEDLLDPIQREAAYRPSYNGPALVTGGPGTGKTRVALHRVRHLLRQSPDTRVLMTSVANFSVVGLRQNLASLLEHDMTLLDRVDVFTVDAYARDVVTRADRRVPRVLTELEERALWGRVAERLGLPLTGQFLSQEYQHVVLAHGLADRDAYLTVSRKGRGAALPAARRALVWSAVEMFEAELRDQGRSSRFGLCHRAAGLLTAEERPSYHHVVVDSAQDLHPAHWRVLRAAVAPDADDLFIVGDPHQRIHDSKTSFRSLGISVAGRCSRLDRSHRSTAEILNWSIRVLGPDVVDGLSGDDTDTLADYHSRLRGFRPDVTGYRSRRGEIAALVDRVRTWIDQGIEPAEILVCARSRQTLDTARAALQEAAVPVWPAGSAIEARTDTVVVAPVHAMKGAEFRCVAIIGVSAQEWPSNAPAGPTELGEHEHHAHSLVERRLLFVACTRARETLAVSWSGEASPIITEAMALG